MATTRVCDNDQCRIPLRGRNDPSTPGTRIHQAKGLCSYCYQCRLESGEISARPRQQFTDTQIRCYSCETWKDYDKFKRHRNTKVGRDYRCSFCAKLWERYALKFPEYSAMFAEQSGKCLICANDFADLLKTNVDHDHQCYPGITSCGGCVRGLLCTPCNSGLGLFKDNLAVVRNAIAYLEKHDKSGL